jgi:hypothetical protein
LQPPPFDGLALFTERGEHFSASGACSGCHTAMFDASAEDVSIDAYWRSTMMANAARDPYWQASVRAEVLANPALQPVIEDKCSTCHMPMARTTLAVGRGVGQVLDEGFVDPQNDVHELAMDGVSCTLCHQIADQLLGEEASFSGGYVIDTAIPVGERPNYGPYQVAPGRAELMQSASGYVPVFGRHLGDAGLCATCHTLYTPFVNAAGEVAGEFPEQMALFEWENSDYGRAGLTCQACHMPLANGAVQISITGGPPQSPFFKHSFVGGNAFMLRIYRTFGEEMGLTASSEHFDATIDRVLERLGSFAASVSVAETSLSASELIAKVQVASATGHKFPTGFPSRRAWIHLRVLDAAGEVVFESGAYEPDGTIAGNDNDADPLAYEPHYVRIGAADQVQIYESIIVDTEGEVTTTLLRGAGYVKDNRLLPQGFDKQAAAPGFAVYGNAAQDEDFDGGGDTVEYVIDVGDAQGPFTVEAELLYQSIGYRWADNLRRHDADEIALFLEYYEGVPNLPEVVSSATAQVID